MQLWKRVCVLTSSEKKETRVPSAKAQHDPSATESLALAWL